MRRGAVPVLLVSRDHTFNLDLLVTIPSIWTVGFSYLLQCARMSQ